jgi:hypothetical protein
VTISTHARPFITLTKPENQFAVKQENQQTSIPAISTTQAQQGGLLINQTQEQPTYYRFAFFTALAFALGVTAGSLFTYVGALVVSIILFILALLAAAYATVQIRARERRMNAS